MPSDTTGPSRRDDPRRPVILDLPAEEVGHKPDSIDASLADDISTAADQKDAAVSAGPRETGAQTSSVWEAQTSGGQDVETTVAESDAQSRPENDRGENSGVASAALAPAKRRTSFAALLTAGLIGGAVAGGGLYALDRSGVLPLGTAERTDNQASGNGVADPVVDITAEVARLEAQIAELRQAGTAGPEPVDLAPLREQIAALEQGFAELRQQPAGGPVDGAPLQDFQTRLTQLEEATSALRSAPPGAPAPALEARLSELAGQIEALRAGSGGAQVAPQLAQLGQRIDELAGRFGAVEGLGQRIDELTGRVGVLEARPPVDLSGLEAAVAELRGQQEQLTGRLEAAPKEERVAALEASLTETSRKTDLAAGLGPAVAADALGSALALGAPFAAELAALRTLGVDEATLATLEPYAGSGLPTLMELRSSFETRVAEADLSVPVPAGAGTLDRLVQSARSLVDVRPANPVPGGEPAAIVARIRAALDGGDLRAALAEWNALPERVRASMPHWARVVEARAAADELVARLRSEALSRLGDQG